MYVRHLSVGNFRSWETAEVPLQPGVTVLVGRNGVGKTNLVEAVGYLATLSSHRVSGDQALIRRGAGQAIVRAAVVSGGRELLLEVEITAGKANRARINRSPLGRARDVLGVLRTVLFAPEDLALVRGDPSERRRFTDEVLVMRSPRLAGVRSDYDRILKQRNTLLKTAGAARRNRSGGADLSTLDVWDEHLASAGSELIAERLALIEALRPHVIAAYAELAPESEPVDLVYRSTVLDPIDPDAAQGEPTSSRESPPAGAVPDPAEGSRHHGDDAEADDNDPEEQQIDVVQAAAAAEPTPGSREHLKRQMLGHLAARRQQELERGISLVGPHRDELELRLGDGPARGYASHGESWSMALSLRLGSFALLRDDGVDPVLVLDDVFAELDAGRRHQLAELVAGAEQVLITAAVDSDVPAALGGRRIAVAPDAVAPDAVDSDVVAPDAVASDVVAPDAGSTEAGSTDGPAMPADGTVGPDE